jgi:hypothetical protein
VHAPGRLNHHSQLQACFKLRTSLPSLLAACCLLGQGQSGNSFVSRPDVELYIQSSSLRSAFTGIPVAIFPGIFMYCTSIWEKCVLYSLL